MPIIQPITFATAPHYRIYLYIFYTTVRQNVKLQVKLLLTTTTTRYQQWWY